MAGMNDTDSSHSLEFGLEILNFRDLDFSVIVVLILSSSGRIIGKRLLRSVDASTATLKNIFLLMVI